MVNAEDVRFLPKNELSSKFPGEIILGEPGMSFVEYQVRNYF